MADNPTLDDLINRARDAQSTSDLAVGIGAKTKCAFCRKPIDDLDTAYRRVSGWAKRLPGVGFGQVELLDDHDDYAHPSCVEAAVASFAPPSQESLLA